MLFKNFKFLYGSMVDQKFSTHLKTPQSSNIRLKWRWWSKNVVDWMLATFSKCRWQKINLIISKRNVISTGIFHFVLIVCYIRARKDEYRSFKIHCCDYGYMNKLRHELVITSRELFSILLQIDAITVSVPLKNPYLNIVIK